MPKLSEDDMAARRHEIIAAAGRCFARKGIQATTMREIFAEAGMSAGAVYNYFRTKDELIEAGIRESTARNVAILSDGGPNASARGDFEQIIDLFLDDLEPSRHDGRARSTPMIHAEVCVKPELLAIFQAGRDQIRIAARQQVRSARPELSEGQAAHIVEFVFLLYQGMVTEAALDAPVDVEAMRGLIKTILHRYPDL